MSSSKDDLSCSFCGKGQKEVKKLIAGPNTCLLYTSDAADE